jgi:hypothetical protein
MTVLSTAGAKEVGEKSGTGGRRRRGFERKGGGGFCQEGSPIVVDLLVACRREERASDVDKSGLCLLLSTSISEAAKDTRAGHWVESKEGGSDEVGLPNFSGIGLFPNSKQPEYCKRVVRLAFPSTNF